MKRFCLACRPYKDFVTLISVIFPYPKVKHRNVSISLLYYVTNHWVPSSPHPPPTIFDNSLIHAIVLHKREKIFTGAPKGGSNSRFHAVFSNNSRSEIAWNSCSRQVSRITLNARLIYSRFPFSRVEICPVTQSRFPLGGPFTHMGTNSILWMSFESEQEINKKRQLARVASW